MEKTYEDALEEVLEWIGEEIDECCNTWSTPYGPLNALRDVIIEKLNKN